jgi:hypothetical protein
MWVPVSPLPPDFCGRPPCGLCFDWKEGADPALSGKHKMALDLLQKPFEALSKDERKALNSIAKKIHKEGIAAIATPLDENPPPSPVADIGMSSTRRLEGWLREKQRRELPKPRHLTCDEVIARQNERAKMEATKKKERDERLKEAREIAEVFAQTEAGNRRNQEYDQQLLRQVDPSFVRYCRDQGIFSAEAIYSRWQREYGDRYITPPLTTKYPLG